MKTTDIGTGTQTSPIYALIPALLGSVGGKHKMKFFSRPGLFPLVVEPSGAVGEAHNRQGKGAGRDGRGAGPRVVEWSPCEVVLR